MPDSPDPLKTLIQDLRKIPGLGEKSATRMAYHLLKAPREDVLSLSEALRRMKDEMRECQLCCDVSFTTLCEICGNSRRDRSFVCVVADSSHIRPLERSAVFSGVYHVLQGTLSPMDDIGPEKLRVEQLLRRLEGGEVKEIVLAINPTLEGEATMLYVADRLKGKRVKVSKLPVGLSIGADIEFTDHETLGKALRDRVHL